jgi:predicted nucleic-acid-binding protein
VPPLEFLDTSVVVRYLTDDPPAMAERAAQLISTRAPLYVTETALAETAHVLRSVYAIDRVAVVNLLQALIRDDGVIPYPSDAGRVIDGLELCRPSGRVSFVDALIWAAALSTGPAPIIYSFDQRFPSAGIQLLEPPATAAP